MMPSYYFKGEVGIGSGSSDFGSQIPTHSPALRHPIGHLASLGVHGTVIQQPKVIIPDTDFIPLLSEGPTFPHVHHMSISTTTRIWE